MSAALLPAPAGPRCYLLPDVLRLLNMTERTYYRCKRRRLLPFLEEIRPRVGRRPRFRADLIDRYLNGEWSGAVAYLVPRKGAR